MQKFLLLLEEKGKCVLFVQIWWTTDRIKELLLPLWRDILLLYMLSVGILKPTQRGGRPVRPTYRRHFFCVLLLCKRTEKKLKFLILYTQDLYLFFHWLGHTQGRKSLLEKKKRVCNFTRNIHEETIYYHQTKLDCCCCCCIGLSFFSCLIISSRQQSGQGLFYF